jgi:hypothetical protein
MKHARNDCLDPGEQCCWCRGARFRRCQSDQSELAAQSSARAGAPKVVWVTRGHFASFTIANRGARTPQEWRHPRSSWAPENLEEASSRELRQGGKWKSASLFARTAPCPRGRNRTPRVTEKRHCSMLSMVVGKQSDFSRDRERRWTVEVQVLTERSERPIVTSSHRIGIVNSTDSMSYRSHRNDVAGSSKTLRRSHARHDQGHPSSCLRHPG